MKAEEITNYAVKSRNLIIISIITLMFITGIIYHLGGKETAGEVGGLLGLVICLSLWVVLLFGLILISKYVVRKEYKGCLDDE